MLKISTPGRVCLFGEHQDYLHLPIIASAISRRIVIQGKHRNDKLINIQMPDINSEEKFLLNGELRYEVERDYFKSAINVLQRKGFTFSQGFDCTINSSIPINAGTSSSSALMVSWINFLARFSDQTKIISANEIARLAYEAEVLEFSEPGGMMDHYSTSVGGIIYLSSFPKIDLKIVNAKLGSFVLGNSNEPKDTKFILANVKNRVLELTKLLKSNHPDFSLQYVNINEIEKYKSELSSNQYELLLGTIQNRNITFEAEKVLQSDNIDHKHLGKLMTQHHNILRDVLKISTPKIEEMIYAALEAGAYGAKINGSGGGGCMFAYAPENTEQVFEAVKKISSDTFIVEVDKGTVEEIYEEVS
ncbi:MAG: GHMP kinase [Ignavibacteriae bacterium]|nr:GHMP kinase [Ignavibacteriota bacterium]